MRIRPDGHEALEPFRLVDDTPIVCVIQGEHGEPLPGARVRWGLEPALIADEAGRVTIRGQGPGARIQLVIERENDVPKRLAVEVSEAGVSWLDMDTATAPIAFPEPRERVTVTLSDAGWIEGRVVDEETGAPIELDQVVLCFFERTEDGEVVLNGCRAGGFEQPEPGHYRIAYYYPEEYHLTFVAEGYHDAEAFTPKVDALKTIRNIDVRMSRKSDDSADTIPRQRIFGAVTRDGRPVETGWVGLWRIPGRSNRVNAPIQRGRTVEQYPRISARAPIRDGRYELNVPYQHDAWYVVAEAPGVAPTQVGPIAVGLRDRKRLDIDWVEGGRLSGRVEGVPDASRGELWVVAFNDAGIRLETPVDADGAFRFERIPAGRFGLKVGHDAYQDAEVPRRDDPRRPWTEEERATPADPWARAAEVTIEPGEHLEGVTLRLPES